MAAGSAIDENTRTSKNIPPSNPVVLLYLHNFDLCTCLQDLGRGRNHIQHTVPQLCCLLASYFQTLEQASRTPFAQILEGCKMKEAVGVTAQSVFHFRHSYNSRGCNCCFCSFEFSVLSTATFKTLRYLEPWYIIALCPSEEHASDVPV